MSSTAERTSAGPKRILMIVANPGVSAMTGWPIGFWASELTHPWYEFREAGFEVEVASPEGGEVRVDGLSDPRDESGYSIDDVLSRGFLTDPKLSGMLADTPSLGVLDLDAFDAIVVCGGQGADVPVPRPRRAQARDRPLLRRRQAHRRAVTRRLRGSTCAFPTAAISSTARP